MSITGYNKLHMEGLCALPVFSLNDDGDPYFDPEKVVPIPRELYDRPDKDEVLATRPWLRSEYSEEIWQGRLWGTDNCHTTECVDNDTITFCSENGFPLPVVKRLSEMHPDRDVTFRFKEDEGEPWEFAALWVFRAGRKLAEPPKAVKEELGNFEHVFLREDFDGPWEDDPTLARNIMKRQMYGIDTAEGQHQWHGGRIAEPYPYVNYGTALGIQVN